MKLDYLDDNFANSTLRGDRRGRTFYGNKQEQKYSANNSVLSSAKEVSRKENAIRADQKSDSGLEWFLKTRTKRETRHPYVLPQNDDQTVLVLNRK